MERIAIQPRLTEKVCAVKDEEELRRRGFEIGCVLGEGSYAKVRAAIVRKGDKDGPKVALKIINMRKAPKDFLKKFLPRELNIITNINHPNIIKCYDVFDYGYKKFIVMEMAGHGDLLEYVKLKGALDEDKSRHMFKQLTNAVEYLHSLDVVHRDLKCENLLLDVKNNIKVSDFGFSREMMEKDLSKTFCGSAAYAAPEILQGIPYSGKSYDIWSMGVILYIMLCGSMPFDDSNIKNMIKCQTERKVGFSRSRKLSDESKKLVHLILESDVSLRASIEDIKNSKWLQTNMNNLYNEIACSRKPLIDKPASSISVKETLCGRGL
ncbi:unnamed protein product [Dimorphilus gyrociliatus]|uniref:Protein kinase domain-containing protein n=1 Tax=Dimorphilus gyrociliatus TaxID=2664684 RepID=A0A7I8VZ50_9ANNE|nr:unnamed protein product [Dimorphilus gyrociliatus]